MQIAEESRDTYSKAYAEYALGISCFYKGFFKEAEEYLSSSADFLQGWDLFHYAALANVGLGAIYLEMGEYNKSQHCYEKAGSLWQRAGVAPDWTNCCRIWAAVPKVMNNDRDINLSELFQYAEDNKIRNWRGATLHSISRILSNIDDHHMDEAEHWIGKSIQANRSNGTMFELGMAHASYAELLKRKGDLSQAKENLNKAIGILKQCRADRWVERYEEELAGM